MVAGPGDRPRPRGRPRRQRRCASASSGRASSRGRRRRPQGPRALPAPAGGLSVAGHRARGLPAPLQRADLVRRPRRLRREGRAAALRRHAERVAKAYGDVVDWWLTLNEPNVYAAGGWMLGTFPPGRTGDVRGVARTLGGLVRAHGAAYRALHGVQPHARVGWAHHLVTLRARARGPCSTGGRPRRWTGRSTARSSTRCSTVGCTGRSPRGPATCPEALGPMTSSGFNTYGRMHIAFDPRRPGDLFTRRTVPAGSVAGDGDSAESHGEPYPQGIGPLARRLAGRGVPVYVLENGVPDATDRLRPWVVATAAAHELHALLRRRRRRPRLLPLVARRQLGVGARLGPALRPLRPGRRDRRTHPPPVSGALYRTLDRPDPPTS